jgi:RecB family endonuclease NucS
MASLEKNFWQEIRKKLKHYQWLRLESYATQGVPDLLGTTQDGMFFTVELKVTKSKRVKVSPHQIAFHKARLNSPSFILVSPSSKHLRKNLSSICIIRPSSKNY